MKYCAMCRCRIEFGVLCRFCQDVFRPDGPEESYVFVNEAFLKERDKKPDVRDRIKRLINASMVDEGLGGKYQSVDEWLLVELVVNECILLLQYDIVRNGNTPENERTRLHLRKLRDHFGIEE